MKAVVGKGLNGWNGAEKKITCGFMNSMGGMGIGTSVIDGNQITRTQDEVDAKGKKSSSTTVEKITDKDTLTWQAVERTGGDVEGPGPVYEFERVQRTKTKKPVK